MSGSVPLLKHTPSAQDPQILELITVQREPLIEKLVEDALDLDGGARHRLLIGPRGMGKTHVLSVVASRLRAAEGSPPLVMAWLEEDPWAFGTYEKFLAGIVACVAEERSDTELAGRAEELRAGRDGGSEEGEQVLRDAVGDARLVLIVENLDEIFRRIGTEGQERFRAFAENWERILIFASAPQLFEGVRLHDLPFYGFFAVSHLEELSLDSANELMRRLAELRGDEELAEFLRSDVARRRLAAIEALAGGHPRIWLLLSGCVSIDAIDELVPLFVEALDNLTPYYQDRLRELGDQQQELVVLLSEAGGALSNRALAERSGIAQNQIATMLRQLADRGYVRRAEVPGEIAGGDARMSYWELREPLMRLCLDVKQSRGRPLRMVVEFLRSWYGPRLLDELAALPQSAELAASYAGEAFRALEAEPPIEDLFRGSAEEILARAERGLALAPERPALWLARVGGLLAEARIDEAREALRGYASSRKSEHAERRLAVHIDSVKAMLREDPMLDSLTGGWVEMARRERGAGEVESLTAAGLTALGRHVEALELLPSALDAEPENGNLFVLQGISLTETGRPEDGLEAFDRAIALRPNDGTLHGDRGLVLRMLGRDEEALASFEAAVDLVPEWFKLHRDIGEVLYRLDRFEEAESAFARAVELDPSDDLSQLGFGFSLSSLGRFGDAVEPLERALRLGAPEELSRFGLAIALRNVGRFDEAEVEIRRVIELDGEASIYRFTLSDIVVGGGDVQGGLVLLGEALALWRKRQDVAAGDPQLACRILWDAASRPDERRRVIDEAIEAYDEVGAGEALGRGLVSSISLFAGDDVSFAEADSWTEDWLAAKRIDDLEIPLRMLVAARDWKRDRDRSHLLELPAEQRQIVAELLQPDGSEEG